MPTPLGQTNSFNSSGATIIPDNGPNYNNRSNARGLAPQGSQAERYLTDIGLNAIGDNSMLGNLLGQGSFDFNASFGDISSNVEDIFQMPLSQGSELPTIQAGTTVPSNFNALAFDGPMFTQPIYPRSTSETSSANGSEFYTTTEIGTDEEDANSAWSYGSSSVPGDAGLGGLGSIHIQTNKEMARVQPYHQALKHAGCETTNSPVVISPSALSNTVTSPAQTVSSSISSPPSGRESSRISKSGSPARKRSSASAKVTKAKKGGVVSAADADRHERRKEINRNSSRKKRMLTKQLIADLQAGAASSRARIHELEKQLAASQASNKELRKSFDDLRTLVNSGGRFFGNVVNSSASASVSASTANATSASQMAGYGGVGGRTTRAFGAAPN